MLNNESLYEEEFTASNHFRAEQLNQILKLIENERVQANKRRSERFEPSYASAEAYERDIAGHRKQFIDMLGWPLNTYVSDSNIPEAKIEFVAEDSLGSIYRLWITALPGLESYGLLFVPKGDGPFPLVISQHGGAGTPELCSGFAGSANYNDMSRRVLRRGVAVYAPQQLLWQEEFGPPNRRNELDKQLKQLGGSITALELFKLKRSLDYLTNREDIIADQVGMIGLSYGGFYTMFMAAVDTRIHAALSSCFFNDRFVYDWDDWTWFNAGNTYLDAEVCGLICPRPLYIEVGVSDELFDVKHAREEIKRVQTYYDKLGLSAKLKYKEFEGGHELDKDEAGIAFLVGALTNRGY